MKIIFIVNALHMQRCVKRIDEFAERGYEVEAYGFDRGVAVKNKPQSCQIQVIGKIDSSASYFRRVGVIAKGIRSVLNATKKTPSVYYLFGLDNVMFFRLQSNLPYIYEESDLVHTYMKSKIAVSFFERIDISSIKKSLLSVFTSEGFVDYHFGANVPDNTIVVPNRLPPTVGKCETLPSKSFDGNRLSIGFVGFIRFNSVYNFAKTFCEFFPNYEFHFYGVANVESDRKMFEPLKEYKNCIFHGPFNYPNDLPAVYSNIDLVVATYDTEFLNVIYAEPNKIYEGIYFETPIIVSSGTFLAKKVKRLGVGYEIDANNSDAVCSFIKGINEKDLNEKLSCIRKIDKNETLNINNHLFDKLAQLGIV